GRRRELLPLLHGALEREGRLGAVDGETRSLARRAYYLTLASSARTRHALDAVLDAAAAEGVPALPLKGPLLAFTVYPDPALRPMGDVDVAVPPGAAHAVAARLRNAGYAIHGEGRRRFDPHANHVIELVGPPGAPLVDLHVRLAHELSVDGRIDRM